MPPFSSRLASLASSLCSVPILDTPERGRGRVAHIAQSLTKPHHRDSLCTLDPHAQSDHKKGRGQRAQRRRFSHSQDSLASYNSAAVVSRFRTEEQPKEEAQSTDGPLKRHLSRPEAPGCPTLERTQRLVEVVREKHPDQYGEKKKARPTNKPRQAKQMHTQNYAF